MKDAVVKTRVGSYAPVYQLRSRAELALALSNINLDRLIQEADYPQIIQMLEAISLY